MENEAEDDEEVAVIEQFIFQAKKAGETALVFNYVYPEAELFEDVEEDAAAEDAAAGSSTKVFHSLQAGHCPIHFADSYPQF